MRPTIPRGTSDGDGGLCDREHHGNGDTHCGYDIRFYPRWLLPPASGHELHHSEKRPTNLSVVMSYGDKFFGTYKRAAGFDTAPQTLAAVSGQRTPQ